MSRCPDFETLSAFADGEAPAQVGLHVDGCARCEATVTRMQRLGDGLRGLAEANEPASQPFSPPARHLPAPRWRRMAWSAAAVAASVAAFAISFDRPAGFPSALADEVVSQHLRAFANGRACEHESSDPHAVSAYLRVALEHDLEVPAPAAGRLVGVRRCSLFGERAGAVVYEAGDVAVTLFVPTPGSKAARSTEGAVGTCTEARDGQTVCVVASQDGTPRLVVGELPASALGTLVALN